MRGTSGGCELPAFSVRLEGWGPESWGCGLTLRAADPVAVLRVGDFSSGCLYTHGTSEAWQGTPFELFERFCERFLGAARLCPIHVVVAIQYDAGLPLHGIALPRRKRQPLLLALAYESPQVEPCAGPATGAAVLASGARSPHGIPLQAAWEYPRYASAFARALDYIAAGDAYQVNLAYPLRAARVVSGIRLFELLQQRNPVAFGAYLHGGDFELVSNSPELFLSRRGVWLTTRPIKGTRPRGRTGEEDRRLIAELCADGKERAELTMIVDLERNDLGRICETGSVEVVAHERVATYATLHHMYSEVRGRLRRGLGWGEILAAMFPGGSVTGAPKRRAMQILHELEAGARGFYTGALGWLRSVDDADFALLIRTAVVDREGVEYWTGGGLVADSTAEREYEETRVKARAFVAALEELG
ncbi:MAG: anthranilate synthase component I family protein [Candidatus Binatia bacterium]|nr:anthranilate synthase component I family protein [Candidatus Binatia bacterium]